MLNKKSLWLLMIILLVVAAPVMAGNYQVRPGVEVNFAELNSPWQVSREAPDFLVRERASALHAPQLEAARKAGFDSPDAAARQMLKKSELFLYNPQSGSYLEIDFSPLKDGEKKPNGDSLAASARYAAEGFEYKEGVENPRGSYRKTDLAGANSAYRADAEFHKDDRDFRFVGVISFARGNWVYLYYTGPRAATEDLAVAEKALESFRITATQ